MGKIIEKKALTYEMADLQKRIKSLAYSLAESEEKSKYATLKVTLFYEKPVQLIDKDFTREFMISIKNTIETIVNAIKGIFIGSIALLFKALAIAVQIIVIAIVGIATLIGIYKVFVFFKSKV